MFIDYVLQAKDHSCAAPETGTGTTHCRGEDTEPPRGEATAELEFTPSRAPETCPLPRPPHQSPGGDAEQGRALRSTSPLRAPHCPALYWSSSQGSLQRLGLEGARAWASSPALPEPEGGVCVTALVKTAHEVQGLSRASLPCPGQQPLPWHLGNMAWAPREPRAATNWGERATLGPKRLAGGLGGAECSRKLGHAPSLRRSNWRKAKTP